MGNACWWRTLLGTEEEYNHCLSIEHDNETRRKWKSMEQKPLFAAARGGRRTHKKRPVSTTRKNK
jgi:hypothetical protein